MQTTLKLYCKGVSLSPSFSVPLFFQSTLNFIFVNLCSRSTANSSRVLRLWPFFYSILLSCLQSRSPRIRRNHNSFPREHIHVCINDFLSLVCWSIVIHQYCPQGQGHTFFSKNEMGFYVCAV